MMRAVTGPRSALRSVRVVLRLVLGVVPSGCREPADPPPAKDEPDDAPASEATGDDADGSGSSGGAPRGPGGDLCPDADRIERGTVFSSLRGATSDREDACGGGGPDRFFVIDVLDRADVFLSAKGRRFEPVIGVLPSDCGADWNDALLCTAGVGGWIPEVAAGTRLLVAVAASPEDPALALPPDDAADPLDFQLSVRFRSTHAAGQPCLVNGEIRCAAGTACLPASEEDGAPTVCTPVPGDTCEQAIAVTWDPGEGPLVLTTAWESLGDAHVHSCGGARTPEIVYRLTRADPWPDDGTVVITGEHGELLAVRGPGCTTLEEIACGDALRIEPLATGWSDGVYLFVERSAAKTAVSSVRVELEAP